jgi:hypothetical protein
MYAGYNTVRGNVPNIAPLLNPSPLLLTLVTCKLLRLDMKLVTRDVKTIFFSAEFVL